MKLLRHTILLFSCLVLLILSSCAPDISKIKKEEAEIYNALRIIASHMKEQFILFPESTVDEAISRVKAGHGQEVFQCPVSKYEMRCSPNKSDWISLKPSNRPAVVCIATRKSLQDTPNFLGIAFNFDLLRLQDLPSWAQ